MRYLRIGLAILLIALTSSTLGGQRSLAGFKYIYVQGFVYRNGSADPFADALIAEIAKDPSWEVLSSIEDAVPDRRMLSATLVCGIHYRESPFASTAIVVCTDVLGNEIASAEALGVDGPQGFIRATIRAFQKAAQLRGQYDPNETVDVLTLLPETEFVGIDPSGFSQYLASRAQSSIEGIWSTADGAERVGVMSDPTTSNRYLVFNLRSHTGLWEPGMVRGRITTTDDARSFLGSFLRDDRKPISATVQLSGERLSVRVSGLDKSVDLVRLSASGNESVASRPAGSRRQIAAATCFAASGTGDLITNFHVLQGASKIGVKFRQEPEFEAAIEATDPASDLAALRIKRTTGDFLPVAGEQSLWSGKRVFAIGYPATGDADDELQISRRTLRALQAKGAAHLMSMSAPMDEARFAGPVVDWDGVVVGVATSTSRQAIVDFRQPPRNVDLVATPSHVRALLDKVEASNDWPEKFGALSARIEASREHVNFAKAVSHSDARKDLSRLPVCRVFAYE